MAMAKKNIPADDSPMLEDFMMIVEEFLATPEAEALCLNDEEDREQFLARFRTFLQNTGLFD